MKCHLVYIEFCFSDNYNLRQLEGLPQLIPIKELRLHQALHGMFFMVFEVCLVTGGT